jgi:multidrug efflux pump subunit AcrA (membrane-fusion protein)
VDPRRIGAVSRTTARNLGCAGAFQRPSSEADKETAEVQTATHQPKVQQDSASVTIAQASVHQAQLNVDHCTITSPIDGIVISREVDEGQTVTSSMTAPTLYVLATDLTHLQLMGEIDESVIGKIHTGQDVAFTVDAYPDAVFHGQVDVMRLTANTVNNVVTYDTVVSAQNPDLRLRPGMTASLRIEAAHATGARVPNLALRFKPTDRMLRPSQSPDAGQTGKQVWKVQNGQLQHSSSARPDRRKRDRGAQRRSSRRRLGRRRNLRPAGHDALTADSGVEHPEIVLARRPEVGLHYPERILSGRARSPDVLAHRAPAPAPHDGGASLEGPSCFSPVS